MRMPVCVFEKRRTFPRAKRASPVRTGQQFCPNRSRWPKKAETGFFPPLRPQRLSCIISIIPRGHAKWPRRQRSPIRRRQRLQEAFHPSAPVNTGNIASISLPQRAAVARTGRIFIVKTRRTVCARRFSFLPAAGKLPIAKNAAEPHAPRDSAFFPPPASFPLLKTPPHRMRRGFSFLPAAGKFPIVKNAADPHAPRDSVSFPQQQASHYLKRRKT